MELRQTGGLDSQTVLFQRVRRNEQYSKHAEAGVPFRNLLNGGKLSARHLASMVKIQGTLCISRVVNTGARFIGLHFLILPYYLTLYANSVH